MTLPLYPDMDKHGLCLIPVYVRTLPNGAQLSQTTVAPGEDCALKWRIIHKTTGVTPGWAGLYNSVQDACADLDRIMSACPTCMDAKLETDLMLTLSTAHLSPETRQKLKDNPETDELCVTVYPKSGFGWYVYFNGLPKNTIDNLPEDILACVRVAQNAGCTVLCFDCDAEPVPYLSAYQD